MATMTHLPTYQHTFVLSRLQQRTSRFGEAFCSCRLTTPGGRHWTAYWWQAFPFRSSWPDGVEVSASVRPRRLGQEWVLDIMDLRLVSFTDSDLHSRAMSSLPNWLLSETPYPVHLRELWAHIQLMTNASLRCFSQRILLDPEISLFWIKIPASQSHHHAEKGGLLRHSVEALRLLTRIESMTLLEWEIARTALLWHDVGKVLGYDQNGKRSMEGWTVAHEEATTEVLASHLAWLRRQNPDLVAALKIHWSSRTSRPLMPGRIQVDVCDRMSAALDSRQQAFTAQPPHRQFACLSGPGPASRFWRPLVG